MLGKLNKAVVDRETQIGYNIKIENDVVFLHYNECGGKN